MGPEVTIGYSTGKHGVSADLDSSHAVIQARRSQNRFAYSAID